MNKKWIGLFFICLLTGALAAIGLMAAEGKAMKTVYVSGGADGSGNSAASPVGTLEKALSLLGGEGGTIVFCGNVSVSSALTIPEQSGDLLWVAQDEGKLTLAANLIFAKNTNANVITLDLPVSVSSVNGSAIFGGFNSVIFGEHFSTYGVLDFFGGMDCSAGKMGEVQANAALNRSFITELPYEIIVHAGNFRSFCGGNRRSGNQDLVGSIAAPLSVTVYGGTFGKNVSYDVASNNKCENAFSISGMSFLADDANLTIHGGVFNVPVYVQGRTGEIHAYASICSAYAASDRRFYALDGNITVHIDGGAFKGGEISAFQTSTGYTQLLRGNFNLTIEKGATFAKGTVIDATQVKAYAGTETRAVLNYPTSAGLVVRRFDMVNGRTQNYEEPLRISFIGDSITQGTGSTDALRTAYPARVLEMAEQEGRELIVANYGVGSSTVMHYGRAWYNQTLAYAVAYHEADSRYILIALGTNDAQIAGGTTGQTERFRQMYKEFVESFGTLPDTEKVFATSAIYRLTSQKQQDVRAVSVIRPVQKQVLETLAASAPEKYIYVDMYALLLEDAVEDTLFAGDKLHPDNDGYVIYARAVYDAIFGGVYTVPDFGMRDIYVSSRGKLNGAGTEDDPVSSLTVAFGMAAPETTIHIVGTVTYPTKIVTPLGLEKLTFVGEGTDASLVVNGDTIKCLSPVKFDNLTLKTVYKATYLAFCYNSAEITETVKTAGTFYLIAGDVLFYADESQTTFDSAQTASCGRDVKLIVNGGAWRSFTGGHIRLAENSPFGVYSGDMEIQIGSGASIANHGYNGINGMNYLSGTITAEIGAWPQGAKIRDYAYAGKYAAGSYDEGQNTGCIEIRIAEGVQAERILTGDLNGDGKVDLADSFLLLNYALNRFDVTKSINYYGFTEVGIQNVQRSLKKLIQ